METGDALGTAHVYRNRWYPGQGSTVRSYDHYFSALARTFDGLERADRPELRGLRFRTVIVDEVGQATEPAALQALRHLPAAYRGRLILVGDQEQLPPVVSERAAGQTMTHAPEVERLGIADGETLRTSLFERFVRRYPERLITLDRQYRMAAPISALISETFYAGALRPGNAGVADQRLADRFSALGIPVRAGSLAAGPRVVFVDTSDDPDALDSGSGGTGDARDNPREADLIAALLRELPRDATGEARSLLVEGTGIISPYRRQNNRIRAAVARLDGALADRVRIDTVDRFQGGERDVIFTSLTNANAGAVIGSLHADWRRMNVALSRARRLLVIVGHRRTFTVAGPVEEEPAKERYRALFGTIDRLAGDGEAEVIASGGLAHDV
ncbi:MAG: DEAD/DEAH box helicase family protein [Thermomicrobiales bacterium]